MEATSADTHRIPTAGFPGRPRGVGLGAGLALFAFYVVLTGIEVLTAASVKFAFWDFRPTAWYMSAVLLFAVAPWKNETFIRIIRGVVLVAAAVGLYAIYRKIVGPSVSEY